MGLEGLELSQLCSSQLRTGMERGGTGSPWAMLIRPGKR